MSQSPIEDVNHPAFGARTEYLVQRIYESVLLPGMHAIDGGANTGQHTFGIARAVGPGGRVVAVEAVPSCVAELQRRMLDQPEFSQFLEVIHAAITEHDGSVDFSVVADESGWSGLRPTPWTPQHLKQTVIRVDAVTLSSLTQRLGGRVDFIKLDLEGGDFAALRGSRALFDRCRPVMTFENGGPAAARLYDYDFAHLERFFKDIDYRVFTINGVPMSEPTWQRLGQSGLPEALAVPNDAAILDALLPRMPEFVADALIALP